METSEMGATIAAGTDVGAAETERRRQWLAVLVKASIGELEAAWDSLGDKPPYRLLRRGETGLVMVRGRIGGTGQPFSFGEMTMTRAAVQLLDPAGRVRHTGFGHVAGRSARRAELVALFDALLQDPTRHDAIAARLLAPLAAGQQAVKAAQAQKMAASKVDFFTMVRGE
jgi:alpha-D-ribose 1-methylphosphonate 5-triphosphate synthase subunit PhnG